MSGLYPKEKIKAVLRQYAGFKADVPDGVLLYRMGAGYAALYADAAIVAKATGLKPTTLDADGNAVPMVCVRDIATADVLRGLLAAGHQVAFAEYVEDPARARRGLVRREVVRIERPGVKPLYGVS